MGALMLRRRSSWIIVILCLVLSLAFFLLRGRGTKAPEKARAAAVVNVSRGTLASSLTVAGQFQPYQEVDLHAKVSGYIRRISVDIGDRVRQGQILATLEIPELQDQLAGTQAQVRHSQSEIGRAQSEIARAQSMYAALHAAYTRLEQAAKEKPGLIAEQELDDARAKDQESQAQIDVAKAALDATQQQLGVSTADSHRVQTLSNYSAIAAPFTGVVTMRYADTGSLIQAGTASNTQSMPVVRVAQSDLLRLRMPVPEADVPYIQIGGEVQVKVNSTGRTFEGKIIRFTRALDTNTRTMLTEVDLPNPDLILSPGMYAETVIQLQQKTNVLIVPFQAIIQNGDEAYVLVVNTSNHVEKRNVTLGIQTANRAEIMSGVQEGDRVIASGQGGYQNGESVAPHPAFVPTAKQEVSE
jgi:RND family efflux transporter MFP subunit